MTEAYLLTLTIVSVGEDGRFENECAFDRGSVYLRYVIGGQLSPDRLAKFLVNSIYSPPPAFVGRFAEARVLTAARVGCRAATKAGKFERISGSTLVIARLSWEPALTFKKISQGREYKVFLGETKIGTLIKELEGWWFQLWDPIPGVPAKTMYQTLNDARDGIRLIFEGRKMAA